jgi:hypothetical protein
VADSPPTFYTPRPDTTPEAEVNALANVYRFILDSRAKKMAAEPAPKPDSCNDAAVVRHTEGVSHVEQRPHRPSEIDHQRLLSPIRERAPKPGLSSRRV